MVCYSIPLISALIVYLWRRTTNIHSPKYLWLNLLLAGGALFGVVDHLWNGELFLISANWQMDLALGVVITLVIIAAWGIMLITPTISKTTVRH